MSYQPPRVVDASAMVAFFEGNPRMAVLVGYSDRGLVNLLMPVTAIAQAQAVVRIGWNSWYALLYGPGLRSMELTEHCAVEIGDWSGELATRHVVHEAKAMRAVIVTHDPSLYKDYDVDLHII